MPTRIIYSQRQWSLVSTFALLVSLFFTNIPSIKTLEQPEVVSWLLHAVTNVAYKTPIVKLPVFTNTDTEVPVSKHGLSQVHYEMAQVAGLEPLRAYLASKYDLNKDDTIDIIASVIKYSDKYNIAPDLILGLIRVESGFEPDAESTTGARGLMQIMPGIHRKLVAKEGGGLDDLWVPAFNIKIGTMILKQMLQVSSGDIEHALARYNGSYGQHNRYAEKVMAARVYFRQYTKYMKLS